jgi:hypothetical protein
MSENTTNNKNVKNDEIDLLDLFRRIGNKLYNWANALGKTFLTCVIFLIKRWLPLTLSIIVGAGVSYLFKSTIDPLYTADLVFRNNLALIDDLKTRDKSGTTSEMISKINKLHIFCSEKNSAELSSALFMKADLVSNISDISAYWIIDQSNDGIPDFVDYLGNHNVLDTTNIRMQDRLNIKVIIKSPQDLYLIRDGIIKYIESDSLYSRRNRLRLMQNHDFLIRLGYDIEQLDSLQKVKYFEETRNLKPASNGQLVLFQEQKTQLFYTDIHILYSKKQRLESDIDLYKGVVTVLRDFSLPSKRNNGGMYYAKKYVPISFLLTLLILIIIANKRKLKEIYNKY